MAVGDSVDVPTLAFGLTTTNDLAGEFVWKVSYDFSTLQVENGDRMYSPQFEIGGYPWKLLLYPGGNPGQMNDKRPSLSLFLQGADLDLSVADDPTDVRKARFTLHLVRQRPKVEVEDVEMSREGEENVDNVDTEMLAVDDQGGGKRNKLHSSGITFDDDGNPVQSASHGFSTKEVDWGFNSFVPLSLALDENEGFLVDNSIVIKATVDLGHYDQDEGHDSRKRTGFVGILNQGATCYMNSLLQTMYNINVLRKAVYSLPTNEDEKPSESMPLALQSVFHAMQFTDAPVDTQDLTKSFGWDVGDAFQQHDAQEFNRILCDRLEEVMKGTKVDGTINKLFQGHFLNYIECINIDYKSVRKEEFLDLQLVVKDCKNIYESFDEYCAEEVLDGDNQYEAEGHGKQDAKKGGKFESLPPVLNIQLRRFEFDFYKMSMVKLNDMHEFYPEIDLDVRDADGNLKYFTSSADNDNKTQVSNKYKLLSVLVHAGSVHGGHYYAYIRPDGVNWLKFDDETVTRVSERDAINENWGVSTVPTRLRLANAYMLVYVRASEWDSIMCEVTEDDIAEHIRSRLRAEEEAREREKKEAMEAHLYTRVVVATDSDIKRQVESNLFMDLIDVSDLDGSMTVKLQKKTPFGELKRLMETNTGIPVDQQRYWMIGINQHGAVRPQALVNEADDVTLSSMPGVRTRQGRVSLLNMYLEQVPAGSVYDRTKKTRSVFIKKYVPDVGGGSAPLLEYRKHALIPATMTFRDMLPALKTVCEIEEGIDCVLLEEVKSVPDVTMRDIDLDKSPDDQEVPLQEGAIIVVQQLGDPDSGSAFPTVTDFFTRVKDRVQVILKPRSGGGGGGPTAGTTGGADGDKADTDTVEASRKTRSATPPPHVFALEMMKSWTYNQVSEAVASHLGLDDPLKVQLTARSVYIEMPRAQAIKYDEETTLQDMCRNEVYTLYYEPIDVPLPEYEKLVTLRVTLHDAKHDEITTVTITMPKDNTVADLQGEIKRAVGRKVNASDVIRCMEIHHWKIWQVYDPQMQIADYIVEANSTNVRAEVVPKSQLGLEEEGRLHVQCLQVEEKENRPHQAFPFSDPFLMDISPAETVGELKLRVQQEMNIPDEEFAEWKVVLVSSLLSMEPLGDDVVISEKIHDTGHNVLYGRHASRSMIGFWHENKNPRRTHAHLHRNAYGGSGATIKMNI